MSNSKLMDRTLELLVHTDKRLTDICREADVSYPWLTAFKGGHNGTKYPAVDKIERLYECLAGKELEV